MTARPVALWMILAVLVTGCSTSEAGTPRPAESQAAGAHESGDPPPSEAPALDDIEPCDLLSADDRSAIGLEAGDELGDLSCDWKRDNRSGVILTLFPDEGSATLPDRGTPVDIGSRDAHQIENPGGGQGTCAVVLDTSASSYVLITASSASNTTEACEFAVDVAGRVASRLS